MLHPYSVDVRGLMRLMAYVDRPNHVEKIKRLEPGGGL